MKYLILGALSSAFLVFGIALIWGTTGELNFTKLAAVAPQFANRARSFCSACCWFWSASVSRSPPFHSKSGRRMFIKARPRRRPPFWPSVPRRPDLHCCSAFCSPPFRASPHWANLLIVISGITILYGNLCAIPQRNLKRLLGYSSIAHAGYLLLGVAALNASGQSALMYYLAGYVFTVTAAFFVIALVMRHCQRGHFRFGRLEPTFAAAGRHIALAMVSLAGIPPLAGFFGKFLLFKSVIEAARPRKITVIIASRS